MSGGISFNVELSAFILFVSSLHYSSATLLTMSPPLRHPKAKAQPVRLGFLLWGACSLISVPYGVTVCSEWLPWGTMASAVGFAPEG
jgi:hypothetical protein